MSNEEIKRAILEMDEREELAKDMLEQVWFTSSWLITYKKQLISILPIQSDGLD